MSILGTAKEGRHKERKKKPDEVLSSVVRETAVPAAVELLRENTAFAFPSGTAWVMLVLEASAIGGLSKRHGRDEAKGSIIQLIESDQIHTVATQEMLVEEFFGIIPNTTSLTRMEEYSLLTGADYAWAVVWQRPTGELIVDVVKTASFQQAREVLLGHLSLRDAVGEQAWGEHSGFGGETDDSTRPMAIQAEQHTDLGDEIFNTTDEVAPAQIEAGGSTVAQPTPSPELVDVPVTDDEEAPEGFDESFAFDDADGSTVAEPELEMEADDDDEPEYAVQDDEATFDEPEYDEDQLEAVYAENQQVVLDAVARRFLSDELQLDIRLDEFNTSFGVGAPVIQMEVPEGASEWLGDQVAQLSRQANAELAHLHYSNEEELRTAYVALMSKHAEEIIREVSTDKEGGKYKGLKDKADAIRNERRGEIEQILHARRKDISEAFEADAKRVAEQAALEAELRFKDRNRPRMERDQLEVAAEVQRKIEDDNALAQAEINKLRRSDAQMKMQFGQSRIFEILTEQHNTHLEAEKGLIESWRTSIEKLVEDHRQNDVVRAKALAEEQARTDEVGALRKQQVEQLDAMRSEHAERLRRLEADFERDGQAAAEQLRARDAEWQHQVDLEKTRTQSESRRADGLADQIEKLGHTYKTEYEALTLKSKADNEAINQNLAAASQMQNRTIRLLTVVSVFLAIFMGVVGVLVGAAWF